MPALTLPRQLQKNRPFPRNDQALIRARVSRDTQRTQRANRWPGVCDTMQLKGGARLQVGWVAERRARRHLRRHRDVVRLLGSPHVVYQTVGEDAETHAHACGGGKGRGGRAQYSAWVKASVALPSYACVETCSHPNVFVADWYRAYTTNRSCKLEVQFQMGVPASEVIGDCGYLAWQLESLTIDRSPCTIGEALNCSEFTLDFKDAQATVCERLSDYIQGHQPYPKGGEPSQLSRALNSTSAPGSLQTHASGADACRMMNGEHILSSLSEWSAETSTSCASQAVACRRVRYVCWCTSEDAQKHASILGW